MHGSFPPRPVVSSWTSFPLYVKRIEIKERPAIICIKCELSALRSDKKVGVPNRRICRDCEIKEIINGK